MNAWMLGVSAWLAAAAGASAGDIFTDEQEFLAAIGDEYVFNAFDDVEPGFNWSLSYHSDDVEYNISAPGYLFCGAGEVSTNLPGQPLVIEFSSWYSRPVTAVAGYFWVRDANFNVIPGQVTIVYDDGTEDIFLSDAKATFRGYVSGGAKISQVQVLAAAEGGGDAWAVIDNLYADPSGVYGIEDEFLEDLGDGFVNPFDDVEFGPAPMLEYGPRRGVWYTIDAPSGLFCNTGEVSTAMAGEPIVMAIESHSDDPRMFGGHFWVRDANFAVVPGWIILVYDDGTEDRFPSADKHTFRGYRARMDEWITGVQVFASADEGEGWAAMDNAWMGWPWREGGCYTDCTGDGVLDLFDFLCFIVEFDAGSDYPDCNQDEALDLFDFLCFTNEFNASC
jgi:hypothetical protein